MIKNWKLFKESVDIEWEIHQICKEYKIENYTINDDFSIDVDGNVSICFRIDKIPLNFNRVSGYFHCQVNKELKSLIGCPQWVGGEFNCGGNDLTSLEFCPEYVGGNFLCISGSRFGGGGNKITSLEYLPKYIGGDFYCNNNKIWSFEGIPDNFRSKLYCKGNPIEPIWKLFETSVDIEFFNDCDIVREPETPDSLPIVILERLNFFLETIGKPTVQKVVGYINI
jgi:hypothetical protein